MNIKDFIESLKELTESWISGPGENDCPPEIQIEYNAKVKAYKEAGETLQALINEYEKR